MAPNAPRPNFSKYSFPRRTSDGEHPASMNPAQWGAIDDSNAYAISAGGQQGASPFAVYGSISGPSSFGPPTHNNSIQSLSLPYSHIPAYRRGDIGHAQSYQHEPKLQVGDVPMSNDTADIQTGPMDRYTQEQTELRYISGSVSDVWTMRQSSGSKIARTGGQFSGYRGSVSNPGSTAYGKEDSGYITGSRQAPSLQGSNHGETHSHHDNENQSLAAGLEEIRFGEGAEGFNRTQLSPIDNASTGYDWNRPQNNAVRKKCTVSGCPCKDLMNPSVFRKHMQKHQKPFKCKYKSCIRGAHGFTSQNDLDRHVRCVHKATHAGPNDRSFLCQGSPACRKRAKVWPRLDNFKSHCKRMHKSEDIEALIQRSEQEAANAGHATSLSGPSHDKDPNVQDVMPRPTRPGRTTGNVEDMTNGGAQALIDLHQGSSLPQPPARDTSSLPEDLNSMAEGDFAANPADAELSDLAEAIPVTMQLPPYYNSRHRTPAFYRDNPVGAGDDGRVEMIDIAAATRGYTEPALPVGGTEPVPPASSSRTGEKITKAELRNFCQRLTELLESDFQAGVEDGSFTPEWATEKVNRRARSLMLDLVPHTRQQPSSPSKRSADDAGMGEDGAAEGRASDSREGKKRQVRCRECSKEMRRMCDLKKHEKRHTRPWGCTNEGCSKMFGSKNDWKRHENTQHYQLETWRCAESSATSKIGCCARIFFRADPFKAHLRRDHGVMDEDRLRDECRTRRIGRNWQDRFWCGFCKDIIKLKKKGLPAWDERFNHIDDEHFKKGQHIDMWYPLDKDIPKGMLRSEKRRTHPHSSSSFSTAGAPGTSAGPGIVDGAAISASGASPAAARTRHSSDARHGTSDADDSDDSDLDDPLRDGLEPPPAPVRLSQPPPPIPSARRNGAGSDDDAESDDDADCDDEPAPPGPAALSRLDSGNIVYAWYCCQCKMGPLYGGQCLTCEHQRDQSCFIQGVARRSI